MEANTVSRVRPEVVITNERRPVVLEMKTIPNTAINGRRDGWLLAKPSLAVKERVDDFINDFTSEPVVHQITDGFMDLLKPEQITALEAKKTEIEKLGLPALESKIEITKAMLEIVNDIQAYEIIQNMTEALTNEHANYDQVTSVIDMYRNNSTNDIVRNLIAGFEQNASVTHDVTADNPKSIY